MAVFLPVCGMGCSLRVRARTPCGVLIAWCVCTAASAHVQPLSGTDTRGTARYRQCTPVQSVYGWLETGAFGGLVASG